MPSSRAPSRLDATWALPAFLLFSGMLCGPTGPFLWPELASDPFGECHSFECPIAIGTEVRMRSGVYDTDIEVPRDPSKLTFTPEGIASLVSMADGIVTIRGVAAGRTQMTATIDGQLIVKDIVVAHRATSQIVALDSAVPPSMASAGLAMMTGATLRLVAWHRSGDGETLVAEGLAAWSLEGATSAELSGASAVWTLQAGLSEESFRVSSGVGAALPVSVVSPDAVASVTLLGYATGRVAGQEPTWQVEEGATISVSMTSTRSLHVAALGEEGMFIVGAPVTLTESPTHLVSVEIVGPSDQGVRLRPVQLGTGLLRLRVGERVVEFPVEVTE